MNFFLPAYNLYILPCSLPKMRNVRYNYNYKVFLSSDRAFRSCTSVESGKKACASPAPNFIVRRQRRRRGRRGGRRPTRRRRTMCDPKVGVISPVHLTRQTRERERDGPSGHWAHRRRRRRHVYFYLDGCWVTGVLVW